MKKKYKLHHGEKVGEEAWRQAVPGGWLYIVYSSCGSYCGAVTSCFVPDSNVEIEE